MREHSGDHANCNCLVKEFLFQYEVLFLQSQASKCKPRLFCKVSKFYPFGSCMHTKSINFLAQMKISCLLFTSKKKLKQLSNAIFHFQ